MHLRWHWNRSLGSSCRNICLYNTSQDLWPYSQIPEYTCSISHNALFRTEMCIFLFCIEHCGIWIRCILGFVELFLEFRFALLWCVLLLSVTIWLYTCRIWDPFYWHGVNSIQAWIINHMASNVWDEITQYPFSNFSGCTVDVWEWISNFIPHFIMDVITYPCWD